MAKGSGGGGRGGSGGGGGGLLSGGYTNITSQYSAGTTISKTIGTITRNGRAWPGSSAIIIDTGAAEGEYRFHVRIINAAGSRLHGAAVHTLPAAKKLVSKIIRAGSVPDVPNPFRG